MNPSVPVSPPVVYTIGHSTRTLREFVGLLRAHGVQRLVDVRTIPRSRHNPQFDRRCLSSALHRARIRYRLLGGLGGFRRPRRDSVNRAWRNASFRGFADYMQTPEFRESLAECIGLARRERIALMCAEAVPWRCHRSLIADALVVRGFRVREIRGGERSVPHRLTPWARVRRTSITYPAASEGPVRSPALRRGRRPAPRAFVVTE